MKSAWVQFAKKKDGGSATDGVSRAAFNKICLEYFEEGMRKPARNGNPGSLESGLAQQRRHFLRGRWRDPGVAQDLTELKRLWATMRPEQVEASRELLEDFSRWKPGPAGRGGERMSRKRGSEDTDSDRDLDSGENHSPYPPGVLEAAFPAGPRGVEPLVQHSEAAPPRKRHAPGDMHVQRDLPPHSGRGDSSGPLELLCNVAFNSDQMPPHHLAPDQLPIMDPHMLPHDGDLAAERMVKSDMSHNWHSHHLESPDLVPPHPLGEDEDALPDDQHQPHSSMHHHRYPPHPLHSHLAARQMHHSIGMEYGHPHAPRMHARIGGYGLNHMGDDHLVGRCMGGEMLPPPSQRAPPPPLENAWDSPSARPFPPPSRMAGLAPSRGGHMHPPPRPMGMMHKSPRHGPMANRSPQHGPMRRSPHLGPASHPCKSSPRNMPAGHPSEMRGEMLPPSSHWKSPGHVKPKKIPGRCGDPCFLRTGCMWCGYMDVC